MDKTINISKNLDKITSKNFKRHHSVTNANLSDGDYYAFKFNVINKNIDELIDWLNKTPRENFYIISSFRSWTVFLHENDAVLGKMFWS